MTVKRRAKRIGLRIPIRVEGHDPSSGKRWQRRTNSLDASPHGAAFVVKGRIQVGQVVHLTLPLPKYTVHTAVSSLASPATSVADQ